jgi:DNA polymerase III subunit beta
MDFAIQRDDMLRLTGRVKGIPPKTANMPILSHLRLTASGKELILTATDLDLILRVKGKVQVFESGDITVPAEPLFRIIRNVPDEQVSFEEKDNHRLKIACGSARFELLGLSGDDFPSFPELTFDNRFSAPSKIIASMLEKTMFAAFRKENGMPHLSGVFMDLRHEDGKGMISMVATDGHRLAKAETPSANGIPKLQNGIIIPLKGCVELLRMARETDGDLELGISETSLLASRENESLVIRLLSGSFPSYKAILDGITGKPVSSERKLLEECLERTTVIADGTSRQVILKLQDRTRLVINAKNQNLGEAEDTLAIRSEFEDLSICFNPDYLLDGLRVMKSRDVEILLNDPQSPAFISGKEDEGFGYIVMPMRA